MKWQMLFFLGVVFASGSGLGLGPVEGPKGREGAQAAPAPATPYPDDRRDKPDSFRYYGPNGLWRTWTPGQRVGRDTWHFWTGGNQHLLRLGTVKAGELTVPLSIEYFRLLDSRQRPTRFKQLGLMNEPNCKQASKPDEYGLWLDEWLGDPEGYYPKDTRKYGEPTGVIGMRKFKNPKFD